MTLLFDQNISFKIVGRIADDFLGSKQVVDIGLENSSDLEIWTYAKKHDCVIVTFDADFYDYSLVWGHPPKVIWIRSENQTTRAVEQLLKQHKENIRSFADDSAMACLEIIKSVH